MNEPLDELYLKWLYSQVGNVKLRSRSRTYWDLLRQLYTKEFVWLIPNDDNRLEDGRALRELFVDESNIQALEDDWMFLGCSLLEMLVALCEHLHFEDERRTIDEWFWVLIDNLGLQECNDASCYNEEQVNEMLDDLVWRTYEPDGRGGLFPLTDPIKDQREEEIWYQMQMYVLENN